MDIYIPEFQCTAYYYKSEDSLLVFQYTTHTYTLKHWIQENVNTYCLQKAGCFVWASMFNSSWPGAVLLIPPWWYEKIEGFATHIDVTREMSSFSRRICATLGQDMLIKYLGAWGVINYPYPDFNSSLIMIMKLLGWAIPVHFLWI